jgi:F plasmid transfer operon protein TraF
MGISRSRLPALALVLLWLPAAALGQQTFDIIGTRALGMAGAFVGVADDATATFWNPAGLASGQPVSVTIGWTDLQSGNRKAAAAPGSWSQHSTYSTLGTWPVGLSYGRIRTTRLVDAGSGFVLAQTLETIQIGGTVLETVTPGVVVGSTLRYVRGSIASAGALGSTVGEAIDRSEALHRQSSNHFDFDIGLMVDMERVRLGLTARNLREPRFVDVAGSAITLKRQARLGLAILPSDGVTLAMDVDLDTVDLRGDLRRMIAFGGENRLGPRLQVRGGIRWDLAGVRRPVGTAGVSFSLRPGLWLDGFVMRGRLDEDRGFGFGLRAGNK